MAKDAYWTSKVLGLHCDGTNGSIGVVDLKGKVVTPAGTAQHVTAHSKFGGSSVYLEGTTSYLSTPSHADFNFGTGDFTIRLWVKLLNLTGYKMLVGLQELGTGQALQLNCSGSAVNATFRAQGGGTVFSMGTAAGVLSTTEFVHVELTRLGTTVRLFVGGVLKASGTCAFNLTPASARPLTIGCLNDGTLSSFLGGYVDDVEIYKGVALHDSDFTPPTEAFPNGDYEVAGTILDTNNSPVARTLRAYRRDTGAFLGEGVSNVATGQYSIGVAHNGEVNVVMLDDALGTLENDQILRTTPV